MHLNVFNQNTLVGSIEKTQREWSFQYDSHWLNHKNAFAISLNLPLKDTKFDHFATHSFFANLLPESGIRTQIARSLGVSDKNDFEILKKIGGECAGALCILEKKQTITQIGSYKQLSSKQLAEFINQTRQKPLIHAVDNLRLSLAGAQHKLPVFKENNQYFLPMGNLASTHILKPQCSDFTSICENEFFCMRLAKALGLPVAAVELFYINDTAILEIERYDRINSNGNVQRLHQEDFCQALGLSFDQKYETEGGATLAQCFSIIERFSAQPLLDKQSLIRIIIFNYLIGNADAHAKNISLLYKNRQIRLAPFYDLLSTIVYHGLTENMAMRIGKEKRLGRVSARHLENLATIAKVKNHFITATFNEMNQTLKNKAPLLGIKLSKEINNHAIITSICHYIENQKMKNKFKI